MQNGFRLGTSVYGALTGRGAEIIIIDYLIAALAALSPKAREQCRLWYFNMVPLRLMKNKMRHRASDAATTRGRLPVSCCAVTIYGQSGAYRDCGTGRTVPIGKGDFFAVAPATCSTRSANQGTFWSCRALRLARRTSRPSISSSL